MSLSFPTSPTVGQHYLGWVGDGDSWTARSVSLAPLGIQVLVNTGVYTPRPGLVSAIVEIVGGGGGAGGTSGAGAVGTVSGGGGSGGYSRKFLTAAQIGASQNVVIGAAGPGGQGNAAGTAGGDTSFGSFCIALGGAGGKRAGSGIGAGGGGAGGAVGTGDFASAGAPGVGGFNNPNTGSVNNTASVGAGGSSVFGGGGVGPGTTGASGTSAGNNAGSYGSGGGGAYNTNNISSQKGGDGSPGVCIVTEYGSSAPTLWTPPTVTSGNRALLTRQVVSTPVASVDFTAGIDTTYDEYEITVINAVNASENASLWLRV